MQQLNGEVERKIKYGFIRLLPLEILFPLIERKIKELIAQIIEYKRLEKER